MNILCLMGLFPKEFEDTIIKDSLSGIQNAANKLQWAIVDGLRRQDGVETTVLNSLYIGSYPKRYKKARIPSFGFDVCGKANGFNVGFLNLPILKYFSKYRTLKKQIDQWVRSTDGEKVIIAYAMTSPFAELLHYVKNKYPSVTCILFMPDLPEYMDVTNKSLVYGTVKKLHISHLKKYIGKIDGYVFLTEYMKEWFDRKVNYTVVEGIYQKPQNCVQEPSSKEKTVLYAGGLSKEYGVLDLVNAFLTTKQEGWRLEIVGDGPLLSTLKQMAEKEESLLIRGLLPNSEVVKRQKQVSVLVNPRRGEQAFTKYSFPSKTIEYMASGTPMIGYRLSGIPNEYYEYIYEVPNEDNGLADCLEKVMALSECEREAFGLSAKNFIEKEKNAAGQCAKIIQLIDRVKVSQHQYQTER